MLYKSEQTTGRIPHLIQKADKAHFIITLSVFYHITFL